MASVGGDHAASPAGRGRPASAGGGLAWGLVRSSRRFFLILALVVVIVLVAGSLASAWVTARNASTLDRARDAGLGVAGAATELRTALGAADASAATTLLTGGLESPETRDTYESELLQAGLALASAALAATDDDVEDITALVDGLRRYAGLVETARANSRQGHPVGASYMAQARALANDELAPRADRLRRSGERRVADAANSVGGPTGAFAMASSLGALVVLVGAGVLVAFRTRRVVHPAGVGAGIAALAALVWVTGSILAQGHELRQAATTDIRSYVAANDIAFQLSSLRVTEIAAVAAHGTGAPLYEQFYEGADTLRERLAGNPSLGDLGTAVEHYVRGVEEVEQTDLGGANRDAAVATLTGASATGYTAAAARTGDLVDGTGAALDRRFDAAERATVSPLVPMALGALAAGLGGAGILARGRGYR